MNTGDWVKRALGVKRALLQKLVFERFSTSLTMYIHLCLERIFNQRLSKFLTKKRSETPRIHRLTKTVTDRKDTLKSHTRTHTHTHTRTHTHAHSQTEKLTHRLTLKQSDTRTKFILRFYPSLVPVHLITKCEMLQKNVKMNVIFRES